MLGFVHSVLFMATLCIGKSRFSFGRKTWIKHGRLEPCESSSGAVQGTCSVTSYIFENCCALHRHLENYELG